MSFDIDGAREVIERGVTGQLVPLGDTVALASSMVALARAPEDRRRMGAEGRRRCLDRFNAGTMVELLEKLYEQMRMSNRE